MNDTREPGVTTLDLVQRTLAALSQKRRTEGLTAVEQVRYRNLCELEEQLLDGLAS